MTSPCLRASASSFVSVGWNPSSSPWSSPLRSSLLTGCSRLRVGSWSLPDNFAVPSATGSFKMSHLCGANTSFALSLRRWISDASIFSKSSMSATRMSPFQILPATDAYPRNILGNTFLPIWWSTKRNYWTFKWFSQTSFVWSLPIRQEICDVSQIGVTFPGICPPFFIQTWLQQYSRGAFLYSARCSFSNPISLRSVWCGRAMIPGEIFTSFAEFQGIVSVNDFRIPLAFQELLQASLCFLGSFCFARTRLDPLGGQVLYHHSVSMIVPRFTSFTENFVICCCQVTKVFSTRYGFAIASSAWGPCNFGPLTDFAISVFREMSTNTVLTQILTSLEYRL